MKTSTYRQRILKSTISVLLIIIIFAVFSGCYISNRMGELPNRAKSAEFAKLSYYGDGKFRNAEPTRFNAKKLAKKPGMLRFLFSSSNAPDKPMPMVKLSRTSFAAVPENFSLCWLGHSTLIFELDGCRFITDPVFGNAAPLPGVVRRYCEPPLKPEDLPELDFVLLSHDHYDHLEYNFIQEMKKREVVFVTALGVGARLRSWGVPNGRIRELGWNDSVTLGKIKITAVPSRHFSGRSWTDRDKTLWASYVFESTPQNGEATGKKIFFGADSAYGKHFADIGRKYGPFDLVCLEIDAWNERWPHNHMFPHEMPLAFKELGGKLFLPIHWGVFDLALHPWNYSIGEICKQAAKHQIPIITPQMGEKVDLTADHLPQKRWWND